MARKAKKAKKVKKAVKAVKKAKKVKKSVPVKPITVKAVKEAAIRKDKHLGEEACKNCKYSRFDGLCVRPGGKSHCVIY